MLIRSFLETFGLVFTAEMGDKTQLMVMTLAASHPWASVFLGSATAFALLGVMAVAIGQVLFLYVNPLWVKLAAAVLFAVLGLKSIFGKEEEGDAGEDAASRSVFWGVFGLIFVAELGDKTQLATMGMAARFPEPLGVFVGATLALWSVSLIGIFLGRKIVAKLPESAIRRGAGVLFLIFAALTAYSALNP